MKEITLEKIKDAAKVLKNIARYTDMIFAPKLSLNNSIYLKTENLQITGSFKVRGAYYKISRLSEEERAKGLVACSAGNHAQGVALSAQKFNAKSIICMPDVAPLSKIEATKSYGAEVRLIPGAYDDAGVYAEKLCKEQNMTFVHPFNDPDVIAGQGSVGLEILEQLPDVDAVVVPIGGGGLISGVAAAIKQMKPSCQVFGVQTEAVPSMARSIDENQLITLPSANTFADGIAVKHPGQLTFELVKKYVDGIVTVGEDEIASAILFLLEQRKLVCEGAGAVAVAAMLADKIPLKGKKVCCLLSGGNIDVSILSRVIYRGLLAAGRMSELHVALPDKPGQLEKVSAMIAECGANVIGIRYNHGAVDTAINSCVLHIQMETRNREQIDLIKKTFADHGYSLITE